MERVLITFLIALTVSSVTGVILFRHFVADQIMDKDCMMNPDYMNGTETAHILDSNHTTH